MLVPKLRCASAAIVASSSACSAVSPKRGHLFRRIFARRQHGPKHRQEQRGGPEPEAPSNRLRNSAAPQRVRDPEMVQQPRKDRADDGARSDEGGLHRVAGGVLVLAQHVADEGPERLHRNVEAGVQHPQQHRGHQQLDRHRHQEQRQRREQRARRRNRAACRPSRPSHVLSEIWPTIGCTSSPVSGAATHSAGRSSRLEPSDWKIRLMFAFCSAKPIWIPKNPNEMFHNPASDCLGFSANLRRSSTASPLPARGWQKLCRDAIRFGGRWIREL